MPIKFRTALTIAAEIATILSFIWMIAGLFQQSSPAAADPWLTERPPAVYAA